MTPDGLTPMRHRTRLTALAALVLATISCGDVARQGRSPVYLVINTLQGAFGGTPSKLAGNVLSDVITNVTSGGTCTTANPCPTVFNDVGQVSLGESLKDVGTVTSPAAATSNNAVTVTRFHVEYRRADGRNTPGVDVPFAFDGAATGTLNVGSPLTLGFELVRATAKQEAPLVQLRISPNIITVIADITFYGTDQVGNAVSVTGSIQIDFGNFADA
jgi:hypothetical protein